MKTYTRGEIIDKLIINDSDNTSFLYSILLSGFRGYENLEDRELIENFMCYILEAGKEDVFIYDNGTYKVKVEAIADEQGGGLKINDGPVEDYEYI
jgi:hypothetical protein